MKKRGVVITGLGVISPIGNTLKDFWDNLISGKSGIRRIEGFDCRDLPTQVAGEITNFNPLQFMEPKLAKRSTRYTQFALAAAKQAVADAGLNMDNGCLERIGVYVGSGACSLHETEITVKDYSKSYKKMPVFTSVSVCNHSAAYNVALFYGITGPAITITSACNSGANALEIAMDQIVLKKIDIAIVIGAETLSEIAFKAFCHTGSMSTMNQTPSQASRPFDRDRDGFVASEGAGAVILERATDAGKRGMKPYSELAGCVSTNDAYNIYRCEPKGRQISAAMEKALIDAKVNKDQVTTICAHGPSMRDTDKAETLAIKKVFGPDAYRLAVPSIKGSLGSPIGATNLFQVISSCLSLKNNIIPPTINYDVLDPECDLDYVPWEARDDKNMKCTMINSHAFGGGNTSVVLNPI